MPSSPIGPLLRSRKFLTMAKATAIACTFTSVDSPGHHGVFKDSCQFVLAERPWGELRNAMLGECAFRQRRNVTGLIADRPQAVGHPQSLHQPCNAVC